MHGSTSHVNREIPGLLQPSLPGMDAGAQREVGRRTPLMHEPGKSDKRVVPQKAPNKARSVPAELLIIDRNRPTTSPCYRYPLAAYRADRTDRSQSPPSRAVE